MQVERLKKTTKTSITRAPDETGTDYRKHFNSSTAVVTWLVLLWWPRVEQLNLLNVCGFNMWSVQHWTSPPRMNWPCVDKDPVFIAVSLPWGIFPPDLPICNCKSTNCLLISIYFPVTQILQEVSDVFIKFLHLKDGGIMVLRNFRILPQNYTAS